MHSHDIRALAIWPPYTPLPGAHKRQFPDRRRAGARVGWARHVRRAHTRSAADEHGRESHEPAEHEYGSDVRGCVPPQARVRSRRASFARRAARDLCRVRVRRDSACGASRRSRRKGCAVARAAGSRRAGAIRGEGGRRCSRWTSMCIQI